MWRRSSCESVCRAPWAGARERRVLSPPQFVPEFLLTVEFARSHQGFFPVNSPFGIRTLTEQIRRLTRRRINDVHSAHDLHQGENAHARNELEGQRQSIFTPVGRAECSHVELVNS